MIRMSTGRRGGSSRSYFRNPVMSAMGDLQPRCGVRDGAWERGLTHERPP
jgi:hypothetical protein